MCGWHQEGCVEDCRWGKKKNLAIAPRTGWGGALEWKKKENRQAGEKGGKKIARTGGKESCALFRTLLTGLLCIVILA